MALGKNYRLGLVKRTSSFGRKRILILNDMDIDAIDAISPTKKRSMGNNSVFGPERSLLEALPQDILIRVLCGVEHDDLKRLFHVSKPIREAVSSTFKLQFTNLIFGVGEKANAKLLMLLRKAAHKHRAMGKRGDPEPFGKLLLFTNGGIRSIGPYSVFLQPLQEFNKKRAMIAKKLHFAYSTPKKVPAFRCTIDPLLLEVDEIEAPNAPRQSRVARSRLDRKKLADLSVALFASSSEEDEGLSRKDLFLDTEL